VNLPEQARAALLKAGKAKSEMFREIERWLSAKSKMQASSKRRRAGLRRSAVPQKMLLSTVHAAPLTLP